ncbi:U-box domain-containing protein [Rickettsiella endosymbiont of Miltochrista miniata]|uniref:U-box domain-containing protein n=1 Tax=Rickettsiella endosymbiont of Miltochrista miniata TaxID=3066239 RepID=UPI00313B0F41
MPNATKNYQSVTTQPNLQKDHRLFAKCLVEVELRSFIKKTINESVERDELPEGHQFLCPISHGVMEDPVITKDGFTFDFKNITQWLQISKTNPLTRKPLTQEQLTRNTVLKKEIDHWEKGDIDQNIFVIMGGTEETWRQYETISTKLLKGDPTIPFKRTTQGIATDLLVKYHREVFAQPEQDRNEILAWYEELDMIEQDSKWCFDGTFCKSKIEVFEKKILFNTDLDVETQLKILEVKNLLIYKHESYDHELIQELENNLKDADEVKIKKLISYYLSESAGNIWWAQTDNRRQALLDKYATVFTGSYLKTVSLNATRWTCYAMSDALKLAIFCPERIGAYVNFVDNPSLENTKQIVESGLVFAMIAILLEHSISIAVINHRAYPEYKTFFKRPSANTWLDLIKTNPGVVGALSVSLGYSVGYSAKKILKATANWECSYGKIMSGNLQEAGLAFAEHPSLLGLLTFALKELGYNGHVYPEYAAFLKNPSAGTWCFLVTANPGIIAALSVSLGYPATRLLKATVNWECSYDKIMSGNIVEAGKTFAEHPSLLGVLTLALKELGYNNHAYPEYAAFLKNPCAGTWCDLITANPGVISALSVSLGCSATRLLKTTVNWECSYGSIMSGNLQETGKAFAEHPSVLGLLTLALKELGYNQHAGPKYAAFFEKPSAGTWCGLITANPGIIGALLVSLGYSATRILKLAVNWECSYGSIMSGNLQETGKAFAEHPSALGLLTLVLKELGYNHHAGPKYAAFLKKPSAETWCNLIKDNPGLIAALSIVLGCGAAYALKLVLKTTANWECNYSKIMSGDLQEAGLAFAEHPSALGLLTLTLKELGYNDHAYPEYAGFLKNPSAGTWCSLITSNPGVIAAVSLSLGYPATRVLKATANWECSYSKIMSGNLQEAGLAFAEHPSALGLLAFALKELGYNHHAGPEYAAFFKKPGVETWYCLVKANPGLMAVSFVSLFRFTSKVLQKTFIDSEDMKIPFFEFLKVGEKDKNYFKILQDCDIPTNELLTSDSLPLTNLNQINESNYLDIAFKERQPSRELIENLRKIGIKIPTHYSNIFSRYWENPIPRHRNGLFKGGLLATGLTVSAKNTSLLMGNLIGIFRFDTPIERKVNTIDTAGMPLGESHAMQP